MDRVVLGGCLLLVMFGIAVGLGVQTSPDTQTRIRSALELLSFLATSVTAVVAVVALTGWRMQFKHTEKFKALRELKDAATTLHKFRGYLLALQNRCQGLLQGASPQVIADLQQAEDEARQNWLEALELYNRAWSTALVFLTSDESDSFVGSSNVFNKRSIDDPVRITMLFANAAQDGGVPRFLLEAREITDSAKHLYASTRSALEVMLMEKFRP